MKQQITLTELNQQIKGTLDELFSDSIWIVAEIGELKVNRTGHCYLELIDKSNENSDISARARATIWAWQFRFIKPYFETATGQNLAAGLKVLVAAKVQFHEVYGLSLNITDIDPNYTLGDLARKKAEIIEQLISDGIFDMNKELILPEIPSKIAIISSPTAAGYEDFLNQLHNNADGYQFYTKLFPAAMQGNETTPSIINALDLIYSYEDVFDVVIIIRGGGSQMDLASFDNYDLAAHICQFPIPVLTGIGHEKDESIADMVAFKKLKTPTAVAEFLIECFDDRQEEIATLHYEFINLVRNKLTSEVDHNKQISRLFKPILKGRIDQLQNQLIQYSKSIKPIITELLEKRKYKIESYDKQLQYESKSFLLNQKFALKRIIRQSEFAGKLVLSKAEQNLLEKEHELTIATTNFIQSKNEKLNWLEKNNELVKPDNVLKRGFSITTQNGKAIKNTKDIDASLPIETILSKGKIVSEIKIKNK